MFYAFPPYIFGCFYSICLIIIILFQLLLIGKCFSVIVRRLLLFYWLFSKICLFFLCPISLFRAFKVVEFCHLCLKNKDKVLSKSLAYFLFWWFYYEGILPYFFLLRTVQNRREKCYFFVCNLFPLQFLFKLMFPSVIYPFSKKKKMNWRHKKDILIVDILSIRISLLNVNKLFRMN